MALSERTKTRMVANKEAKRIAKLHSIARNVKVTEFSSPVEPDVSVMIDRVFIEGKVKDFNRVIETLGFRPIRLTHNMLNPESPTFAIDIDTPSYCDPGCESYHSM